MKNYIIIRNYIHKELIDKTPIDDKNVRLVNGDGLFYGLKLLERLFLEERLQDKYEYVVFVDEDCFVYDEKLILSIISYMGKSKYDICGVPDGGTVLIRQHRPDVPNLFFTIIRTKKLRDIGIDEDMYMSYIPPVSGNAISDEITYETTSYKYDTFEPYYKILCYFVYECGMKFLPLTEAEDGLFGETEVYFSGNHLCTHTWYSRMYGKNKEHTDRINSILERAAEEKRSGNE